MTPINPDKKMFPIPVIVITGFLGSGKTTLLQRLLISPELTDAAVLINELGEIGLDHHLVQKTDEDIVMLASGCVCCTIREDLGTAMRGLLNRREKGEIPEFKRLVIETTGIADPVPILYTLTTEPGVKDQFRIQTVITTVDAVNGIRNLTRQPESSKQVALANHLVVTKEDLVDSKTLSAIIKRLSRINPSADVLVLPSMQLKPNLLLAGNSYNFDNTSSDVREWLDADALSNTNNTRNHPGHGHHAQHASSHDEKLAAFSLDFDEAINWTAFGVWLTMLLHHRGEDVLRVKALINVGNLPGPVVVQGVQHIIHPPIHLDSWPDKNRQSRIIFITRNISKDELEASLTAFNNAAHRLESDKNSLIAESMPMGAGMQIGGRPFLRKSGLSWMK